MRPGKGVPEGGILTGGELSKINDILCQKIFVFPGQPNIMKPGIVRADDYIHSGRFAALEHYP